jgi:MFS superfamily sulfate permease-like transporter
VNDSAGAKSRLASVVTAGLAALTLLVLAPVFDDLPEAVLGAIVVVAAVGLILSPELRRTRRVRTRDWGLALVALGGILLLGTLRGILVAVVVSVLVLLYEASRPPVRVLEGTRPGLLGVRVEGAVFFANARRLFARVTELVDEAKPNVVLSISRPCRTWTSPPWTPAVSSPNRFETAASSRGSPEPSPGRSRCWSGPGTRHERFPTPTRRSRNTVGAPDRDHPDRMMKLLEGE